MWHSTMHIKLGLIFTIIFTRTIIPIKLILANFIRKNLFDKFRHCCILLLTLLRRHSLHTLLKFLILGNTIQLGVHRSVHQVFIRLPTIFDIVLQIRIMRLLLIFDICHIANVICVLRSGRLLVLHGGQSWSYKIIGRVIISHWLIIFPLISRLIH